MARKWKRNHFGAPDPVDNEVETELTILIKSTRMKLRELEKISDLISETLEASNYLPETIKVEVRVSSSLNNGSETTRSEIISISVPKEPPSSKIEE